MTNRLYLNNNNYTKKNMLDIYNRVLTQKKYTRASMNPLNAEKSMSIRKGLRDLDIYDDNLQTADELFRSAETSLTQVSSNLYNSTSTFLIQGANTPIGTTGLTSVGVSLRSLAEEMVDTLNADFNGRQLFGGTSSNPTPFTIKEIEVDEDAPFNPNGYAERVLYHGIDMTTIYKDDTDGLYYGTMIDEDGTLTEDTLVPGQGAIYLDIGLGISHTGDNYTVDGNTALDTAMHGFEILGFGTDADGYPINIIQLTLDASKVAGPGDLEQVGELSKYIDKTSDARDNVMNKITQLGVQYNEIEYYLMKNDDYRTSLKERQNTVEGTDIIKDITEYYAVEAAYNASLQMGGNILPKSIFDFI
jgi:flagellar hook-associated protein 3 FlgL